MTKWTSLHIYLHGRADHTDQFLVDCLAPAADALVADGDAAGWFFIRYWAGGPHLRLRLRDADLEAVRLLTKQVTSWLAGHPVTGPLVAPAEFYAERGGLATHGWHEHGEIVPAVYEPEVERYGGSAAIAAAERLFEDSTQVAVAAVRGSLGQGHKLGVAFTLLVALGSTVCDTAAVEVAMLRRYVLSARYNTVEAPATDPVAARELAEREFAANAEKYRTTVDKVRAALDGGGRTGYLGHWARCAGEYAERIRALDAAGELIGFGSGWTVLLSQMHMLHNRMGVSIPEEYYLCWLASLVRAGATTGAGYHAAGLDTAARRYHEQAKYLAHTLAEQAPRPVSPRARRHRAGTPLPDPRGAPFICGRLADAFAARRSSLGPYAGTVSAEVLSALLHHAARDGTVRLPGTDTEITVRPYPSAGALLSTRVLALPARVLGVEPALYEYLPGDHSLRPVAPAPGVAQLASVSPYFDTSGPVSLDVGTVPLWLFLIGDISLVTERYGLRGYRFLLLELGHLAQNLMLAATGLGLRLAPIGAFYDDALAQVLELDAVTDAPFYMLPMGHA